MLFVNNGNPASILIRLGEGCVTNCYNCNSFSDNTKYYSYNDFLDVIKFIGNYCENTFSIFLFGTNSIHHNDIEKFLEDSILLKFRISIHISPLYIEDNIRKIKYLSIKYPNVFFETCYMIKTKSDLINTLKTINYLTKNDINSSMDLFIDYNKFLPLIIYYFKNNKNFDLRIQKGTSHLNYPSCYEFISKNRKQTFMFYNQVEQKIINGYITNLPDLGCVARKTFHVDDDTILVNEEIEITRKGVIKMHINTYCNKAIQKISTIYKSKEKIIYDFKKLDNYLDKYDKPNMAVNCFNCISSPYINE